MPEGSDWIVSAFTEVGLQDVATSTTPDGSDCVHGHALEDFVPQNADLLRADVEEPACLIHAPNESVAPSEIEHIALAEALFMRNYAATDG